MSLTLGKANASLSSTVGGQNQSAVVGMLDLLLPIENRASRCALIVACGSANGQIQGKNGLWQGRSLPTLNY